MRARLHYDPDASFEMPAYSIPEVASYARVPTATVRYWTKAATLRPLLVLTNDGPFLSFANLLECHILHVLRTKYHLRITRIRNAIETLRHLFPESRHPLIEMGLQTDKVDLFDEAGLLNLSRGGQGTLGFLKNYMTRIDLGETPKFFPFVVSNAPQEPKIISVTPQIAFGRSVIDGTGLATAVISARFNARESIESLAEEYGRERREIEEAVRWEAIRAATAA
jgi:uncharacterized protein (DUF433 family)